MIIVHRKQLFDQWIECIQSFLGIAESFIGKISPGLQKIGTHITVAMIQSLAAIDVANQLFQSFGLIIIDEEHDTSYKQQDPAPRYHARDAAIYYASLFNAKVLLGSATPSLESYYNAQKSKYGLVELNERFGGIRLPTIEIIDVRQVAQKGKVMLSPQLKEAIEKTVENGRQVILFQNRRGYSPYLICVSNRRRFRVRIDKRYSPLSPSFALFRRTRIWKDGP